VKTEVAKKVPCIIWWGLAFEPKTSAKRVDRFNGRKAAGEQQASKTGDWGGGQDKLYLGLTRMSGADGTRRGLTSKATGLKTQKIVRRNKYIMTIRPTWLFKIRARNVRIYRNRRQLGQGNKRRFCL